MLFEGLAKRIMQSLGNTEPIDKETIKNNHQRIGDMLDRNYEAQQAYDKRRKQQEGLKRLGFKEFSKRVT